MNRRDLIQLSLMAALAPAQQLAAATKLKKTSGSAKKGLCISPKSKDWDKRLKELGCKWFYTWTPNIADDAPRDIPFVPMIWKYRNDPEAILKAGKAAEREGIKELLGFNEPDRSNQANMAIEEAIAAWPALQKTGLRLGSPACAHPDNNWMQSFMEEAKKLDLKIDFICVHSYTPPNSEAFIKRLEKIHKLYRKPIWITEFAVGDWSAKTPAENKFTPKMVLEFMEDTLPKLERLDFVERYAWFPADTDSSALCSSALHDAEGKLTRLGECYRDA